MKFNTFQRPYFAGELWDYTSEQDPLTGKIEDTYYKDKDIEFSLVAAEKGLMYLFHREQLRYNAQVRNITDRQGELVFPEFFGGDSKITYVGISEPVFDVWGNRIGYRHDLSQGV